MSEKAEPKTRNRAETTAALLAAAMQTLAEEGFAGFGVNTVARRAGCDKQLIYRYFGGMEGLAAALGQEIANLLTQALGDPPPMATYADLIEELAVRLLRAFRDNPLLAQVAAWEAAEPSALARILAAKRGPAMAAWLAQKRGALMPPEEPDAPAINALLIGAVQQLALQGAAQSVASGLPLRDEKDWARAEKALRALVQAAYGNPR